MTVVSSGWIDLKDNVSFSFLVQQEKFQQGSYLYTLARHILVEFYPWGPFLKTLNNFLGPKAIIKLKSVEQQHTNQSIQLLLIFKIVETLILNANSANIKQLFGPKRLVGLSKKGPLYTYSWYKRNIDFLMGQN